MAIDFDKQRSQDQFDASAAEPSEPIQRNSGEAPDRGNSAREAPETWAGRSAEAPDAGEGRMALMEHEFTHGRSQC